MKVVLVILDGWGWAPTRAGNLVLETATPVLNTLLGEGRGVLLRTASLEVGLPWGEVGDSELGHYNLGTGQIVLVRREKGKSALVVRPARAGIIEGAPIGLPTEGEILSDPQALATAVSLGASLAAAGRKQVKLASSAKLTLLTGAMNGYPNLPLLGERSVPLPVETSFEEFLAGNPQIFKNDLVVVNFSAADEAAHRGNLGEVKRAIRATDQALGILAKRCAAQGAVLYLVADHGNIETMLDSEGQIDPGHSTAPVVFARVDLRGKPWPARRVGPAIKEQLALVTPVGVLADAAPTLLDELGLPIPPEMVGITLRPEFSI